MSDSLLIFDSIATAGWAEDGGVGLLVIMLGGALLSPLVWLSHPSWWVNLLGVCLLAADVAVGAFVGKRTYRFLRERCRVPESLLGLPLIPLTAIPIFVLNVTAYFTSIKCLPHSFFAR